MAMAFLSVSCDDDPMGEETNPFVGTWENAHGRFIFTETTVKGYALNEGEILWYSGTYTYDDNNIYITTDYRVPQMLPISEIYPQPLVFSYSIEGDTLIWATITTYTKKS